MAVPGATGKCHFVVPSVAPTWPGAAGYGIRRGGVYNLPVAGVAGAESGTPLSGEAA